MGYKKSHLNLKDNKKSEKTLGNCMKARRCYSFWSVTKTKNRFVSK